MDLAYLRAHPQQLPLFLTHQRVRETPVGGGSICQARRLTLEDGSSVFVKSWPEGSGESMPPGLFATEAAGLRWLAEAGAVAVPEVIVELPDLLALTWVDRAEPSPAAAERFGRELARLHQAGAPGLGAPWPGFIGSLPQDNGGAGEPWPQWFANRRLRPFLELSARRGALSPADVGLVERILANVEQYAGPPEAPSRLHGDLWPGNLLWTADRVCLVDPAAHGGHRESDLAQLALFGGVAYLDRILGAYAEQCPLADGWPGRVPLHQLHLLLVHTALFGATYRDAVVAATTAVLRG